jgi:hypothetical protein
MLWAPGRNATVTVAGQGAVGMCHLFYTTAASMGFSNLQPFQISSTIVTGKGTVVCNGTIDGDAVVVYDTGFHELGSEWCQVAQTVAAQSSSPTPGHKHK